MNFYGQISRITPKDKGVEIRLLESHSFDEALERPVRVIEAKECPSIPKKLQQITGEEIDGYEIKEDRIDIWLAWDSDHNPLSIKASTITERSESYDLTEYSEALQRLRKAYQQNQSALSRKNQKMNEILHTIEHELDNLSRRIEFQPEKKDQHSKTISILRNLKQRIERPNQSQ